MLTNSVTKSGVTDGTNDGVARYNFFNAWPAASSAGGDVPQQEWSYVYEMIQR